MTPCFISEMPGEKTKALLVGFYQKAWTHDASLYAVFCGVRGFPHYKDLLHLADLIDRPTTTRHGKFKTKYGRETPCCEVCGYSIGDMRWNHCPKCGAAIVDD